MVTGEAPGDSGGGTVRND